MRPRRSLPGPSPPRFCGRAPWRLALALRRDPVGLFEEAGRCGDVVELRFPFRSVYLLSHPDHVRQVLIADAHRFTRGYAIERAKVLLGEGLLTSEGEGHRRRRQLIQPSLRRPSLDGYVDAIRAGVRSETAAWADGASVDVYAAMLRITLTALVGSLFRVTSDETTTDVTEALGEVFSLSHRLLLPGAALLQRLPLPSSLRLRRAVARLDAAIYPLIDVERRAGRSDTIVSALSRSGVTDRQLRDEVMTLLLAGHETTASALAWTWHLLSRNSDVEEGLHEEIRREIGDDPIRAESVPRLKLARSVVAESMRLYPPVWSQGRTALEDVEVGEYAIPRGGTVVLSQWNVHRDPRFWQDPSSFSPERFAAGREAGSHGHAFFPFGEGGRKCVGEDFAWMSSVIILATLAREWRLRSEPDSRIGPIAHLFLLHPGYAPASKPRAPLRRGLPMRVERREVGAAESGRGDAVAHAG